MPFHAHSPHRPARLRPGPRPLRPGRRGESADPGRGIRGGGRIVRAVGRPGPGDADGAPPRAGRILGWFRKLGSRPDASSEVPALTAEASPYFPGTGPRPGGTDAGRAPAPPRLATVAAQPLPREARPSSSRNGAVDSPVRRVQAAPGEVQPTPFTPGVLQPGAGGALMGETVPTVGGQSISLAGGPVRRPDQQPRPGDPAAGQSHDALGRGRRGRPALPHDPQSDALVRPPPDHADPARPVRRHGPDGIRTASIASASSTSTCRSASRSSWGTRRRTATTSPRPPTSSSSGPSSRPSCWPWSRPIASSRRPPIAASG